MRPALYLKDVVTLSYQRELCNGCGTCLDVCPREVLRRSNGKIEVVTKDACMECGACQRNCPRGALTVTTGVGCAAAVINQMIGRKKACCTTGNGSSSCC
jgi:NAD-dependent dihydropyrimidine dehydrogenase PreA subunit